MTNVEIKLRGTKLIILDTFSRPMIIPFQQVDVGDAQYLPQHFLVCEVINNQCKEKCF